MGVGEKKMMTLQESRPQWLKFFELALQSCEPFFGGVKHWNALKEAELVAATTDFLVSGLNLKCEELTDQRIKSMYIIVAVVVAPP